MTKGAFTRRLQRVESILVSMTRVICVMLLLVIVFDVFLAVLTRYLLHYPFNFADQLAKYLVIWVAFIGASLAVREGAHISVEALTRKLPIVYQKRILIVVNIVVSMFLILIIWYGFQFAWSSRIYSDPLVFGISMMYAYLSVPVGFLFVLVQLNLFTIIAVLSGLDKAIK